MTMIDETLDLGQLAVIAEAFTGADDPISVEVVAVDDLEPRADSRGWVVARPDAMVMLVELGSPSPELVSALLAHLGDALGVAPVETAAGEHRPAVAPSVVAVRDESGNGMIGYLTPGGTPSTPPVAAAADDDLEASGLLSLGMLREVPLEVSAELGRTRLSVAEILQLNVGSVIELDRTAGAPVDVVVNGSLIARGEVVVIDDEYGIRITEILGRLSDTA